MIFKHLVVGPIEANCYLIGCPDTLEAAVIDPGGDPPKIIEAIKANKLKVKYIINTHGHIDHIEANGKVQEATGAQILIHKNDAPMLTSPRLNLSTFVGGNIASPAADWELQEGDEIKIGQQITLQVIHTPGHSPGSICLQCTGDILISGDTLFAGSIGRTDFPGGSYEQLIEGVREKLFVLPDAVVVYPGHGPSTTIGFEKKSNPFF